MRDTYLGAAGKLYFYTALHKSHKIINQGYVQRESVNKEKGRPKDGDTGTE